MEPESTTTTPEDTPETEVDGTQDAPEAQPEGDDGNAATETAPDPEQLQSELSRARKDAAKYRRQLRELQAAQTSGGGAGTDDSKRKVIDAIGADAARALGIEAPAEPARDGTDRKLAEAETARRQAQVEVAVLREASRQGVDGDALLDSRSFIGSLADLDPSDSDFAGQVADAIKDNAKNGRKAGTQRQAPARSGTGQLNGAPGGQRQWTAEQVKRATPADVAKAMRAGLLRDYMTSPA